MKICKKCNNKVVPNNHCLGYYCYKCGNIKHQDVLTNIQKGTMIKYKDDPISTYIILHAFAEDFFIEHFDIL